MTRIKNTKDRLQKEADDLDMGQVGIYTSRTRFKKFQALCSPKTASAVIDKWIQDAIKEEEKGGKKK